MLDLSNPENLRLYKEFDLGYGTREALRESKPLNDLDVITFRKECRQALVASCIKIQEKSPLKFTLTKGLSFLSPQITLDSSLREERLSIVLQALVEIQWLKGIEVDQIQRELSEVCRNIAVINHLKSFDRILTVQTHYG